jgi:hypothetical protein
MADEIEHVRGVVMSKFVPITNAAQLPSEGAGYEHALLDLKERSESTTAFHKAKDVAAFANHLGGTLLVGAKEQNGRVRAYCPLTEKALNAAQAEFSQAIRDRCSPSPVANIARIACGDGFVLAINVDPHLTALVGVRISAHKPSEGYGGDSYVFPVRTVSDTVCLTPEQVPMFIQPAIRRAVVLLQSIPDGAQILIRCRNFRSGNVEELTGIIGVEVDESKNVARFKFDQTVALRQFPLDLIVSVYEEGNHWTVLIRHWTL